MKTLLLTLLAVSLALAGCTADNNGSSESTSTGNNTGGGGSEVHGTVEVTGNNTTSPTPATPTPTGNATTPANNSTS